MATARYHKNKTTRNRRRKRKQRKKGRHHTMQTMETYIRAGYSAIFVQTQEEDRAVNDIKRIANKGLKSKDRMPNGYNCLTWTVSNGVDYEIPSSLTGIDLKRAELERQETQDPGKALEIFMECPDKIPRYSILIMLDLHLHFKGNNPMLVRMLKEAIRHGRKTNRHIVMIGAEPIKHPELEKEIQVIDLPLPDKAVLTTVLEDMARAASIEANGETDAITSALAGLTAEESVNAMAFSLASKKKLDVELIAKIKTESIKKNGIVEIVETHAGDMDGIGGLENVKTWLRKRISGFTKEARDFGVEAPKGYMLIGISGCGKSEVAKVTASLLGVPMLRMDGGKIFNSFIGESERNMRMALRTAEVISPCLLMIDELEKMMSGAQSSGKCDSGVTSRVIGTLLQWMQDKTAPVFVVACLTEDALVACADGVPRSIKEIKEGDKIYSANWTTGEIDITTTDLKVNPTAKRTITIRTSTTEFTGTPNHPVFVLSESGIKELPLEEVNPGMSIARLPFIPQVSQSALLGLSVPPPVQPKTDAVIPTELNNELAQLLGFITADGHLQFQEDRNGFRIGFHDKTEQGFEFYKSLCISCFGRCGVLKMKSKKSTVGYVDSRRLGNWIKENFPELLGGKQIRHVPSAIFKSSNQIVSAFLRGFFDGDGQCSNQVSVVGTNQRLIQEIGLLLQRLGVGFSRFLSKTKMGVRAVGLCIKSLETQQTFSEQIGFSFDYKNARLKSLCGRKRGSDKPSLTDSMPVPWQLMDALIKVSGKPLSYYPSYIQKRSSKKRVAKHTISEWLNRLGLPFKSTQQIRTIMKFDWDKIIATKTNEGQFKVYDVRVPHYSNYVANGIVMHNTANDVSQLPPEMLRRGRFDQIFFVDLPDHEERQHIWSIHINKVKRKPKDYDLARLSKETEDYTGAEIASIVRDGLCNAFHEKSELTTDILSAAIKEVVPLSKTMKERITSIRQWANGRAIRASGSVNASK